MQNYFFLPLHCSKTTPSIFSPQRVILSWSISKPCIILANTGDATSYNFLIVSIAGIFNTGQSNHPRQLPT